MKIVAILVFSIILIVETSILVLQKKPTQLVSPLLKGEEVMGINLWAPNLSPKAESAEYAITSKAALFIDSSSGNVLYAKNAHEKLPVASLVKVMAVLIALEHRGIDEVYKVSQRASEFEPDKMSLIPDEEFILRELLYGIFLISANDAAEVLAEGTVSTREEFIRLMNIKTTQLGMKSTHFVNPTGLDEDGDNSYSTVYDLALLTRYLIKHYPEVVEITQTPHIYFEEKSNRQSYDMYSGINLLTTYPGVIGFKTGYTPEAGYTLITLARKEGHEVIGILLGSDNRREEARELLDYSFKKFGL